MAIDPGALATQLERELQKTHHSPSQTRLSGLSQASPIPISGRPVPQHADQRFGGLPPCFAPLPPPARPSLLTYASYVSASPALSTRLSFLPLPLSEQSSPLLHENAIASWHPGQSSAPANAFTSLPPALPPLNCLAAAASSPLRFPASSPRPASLTFASRPPIAVTSVSSTLSRPGPSFISTSSVPVSSSPLSTSPLLRHSLLPRHSSLVSLSLPLSACSSASRPSSPLPLSSSLPLSSCSTASLHSSFCQPLAASLPVHADACAAGRNPEPFCAACPSARPSDGAPSSLPDSPSSSLSPSAYPSGLSSSERGTSKLPSSSSLPPHSSPLLLSSQGSTFSQVADHPLPSSSALSSYSKHFDGSKAQSKILSCSSSHRPSSSSRPSTIAFSCSSPSYPLSSSPSSPVFTSSSCTASPPLSSPSFFSSCTFSIPSCSPLMSSSSSSASSPSSPFPLSAPSSSSSSSASLSSSSLSFSSSSLCSSSSSSSSVLEPLSGLSRRGGLSRRKQPPPSHLFPSRDASHFPVSSSSPPPKSPLAVDCSSASAAARLLSASEPPGLERSPAGAANGDPRDEERRGKKRRTEDALAAFPEESEGDEVSLSPNEERNGSWGKGGERRNPSSPSFLRWHNLLDLNPRTTSNFADRNRNKKRSCSSDPSPAALSVSTTQVAHGPPARRNEGGDSIPSGRTHEDPPMPVHTQDMGSLKAEIGDSESTSENGGLLLPFSTLAILLTELVKQRALDCRNKAARDQRGTETSAAASANIPNSSDCSHSPSSEICQPVLQGNDNRGQASPFVHSVDPRGCARQERRARSAAGSCLDFPSKKPPAEARCTYTRNEAVWARVASATGLSESECFRAWRASVTEASFIGEKNEKSRICRRAMLLLLWSLRRESLSCVSRLATVSFVCGPFSCFLFLLQVPLVCCTSLPLSSSHPFKGAPRPTDKTGVLSKMKRRSDNLKVKVHRMYEHLSIHKYAHIYMFCVVREGTRFSMRVWISR
ncbi:UNVERIFIED_CONTAM: hypothetical protein HHA_225370 [Hammondia hammondi]|eukprot:XP_008881919.1 hypothetical protein HHA_225370 [Hammondia hammondi]